MPLIYCIWTDIYKCCPLENAQTESINSYYLLCFIIDLTVLYECTWKQFFTSGYNPLLSFCSVFVQKFKQLFQFCNSLKLIKLNTAPIIVVKTSEAEDWIFNMFYFKYFLENIYQTCKKLTLQTVLVENVYIVRVICRIHFESWKIKHRKMFIVKIHLSRNVSKNVHTTNCRRKFIQNNKEPTTYYYIKIPDLLEQE